MRKLLKPKKIVSIYIEQKLDVRLERIAVKGGVSKSKIMENMLIVGVDYLETMDNLGVLAIARIFEDMRQKIIEKHDGGPIDAVRV